MIIKNTGKIIDDLYIVGTPAMPVFPGKIYDG